MLNCDLLLGARVKMANVNGPYCGMYHVKPFYDKDVKIIVPDVIYKLKNIHSQPHNETEDVANDTITALEKRQEAIFKKLEDLQGAVKKLQNRYGCTDSMNMEGATSLGAPRVSSSHTERDIIEDIVINANPEQPPLSLFVMYELLHRSIPVFGSSFIHSSVSNVADSHKNIFHNDINCQRGNQKLAITFIWKNVEKGPTMMVNPQKQTEIYGEANIARYIARIFNPNFDTDDLVIATEIDQWLDTATFNILCGNSKERAAALRSLNSKLGRSDWLVGSSLSLADIVVWSALHQSGLNKDAPANVKKWIMHCNLNELFQLAQKFL